MDASEAQLYEHQLAQVESALAADPSNAELQKLRDELANLINLTKSLHQGGGASADPSPSYKAAGGASTASSSAKALDAAPSSDAATSAGAHTFAAGEDCTARYAGDGRWYPARIVSVGGAASNPVYSVIFKGYNNTENLTSADLRPLKHARSLGPSSSTASPAAGTSASASPAPGAAESSASASGGGNKKLTPEEEAERERKRRRNERKTEKLAAKQAAQVDKQAAWQKFAKKGVKKGVLPGEKSIFKTPDDPYAKVGVVGGGRGMTAYNSRSKHVYDGEGEKS